MKKVSSSSTHLPMTELGESHEQSVREPSPSGDPHAIPASQEETILWDGEIIGELQKNPLVSAHINAVRNWSEIVFGKKGVLDTKIKKILENPPVSNRILWAIALNPQSIHQLAGKNICGFKNRARRNAAESLIPLHDAIYGLAKTSESARSRIISPMGQSCSEKTMEGAEAVETLLASCNHTKKMRISDHEIVEILQQDPFIQKCEEEIRYWCTMVYGCPDVLIKKIADIRRDPLVGFDLLEDLANTPYRYHSLAGFGICCLKNRERRNAEFSVRHLHNCVYFFSKVIESAKELIQMEYLEQKEHTDISQNQTPEAVARNVQHTRAEHHPTPQQEQPRRVRSGRMALTM
ncbi:BID domain-containing T4SS effector [Bartonella taylorii]|uniref:BID domain-containing T4SS effector n=1 Tax=Bartonella taylorii TaxID=33046 RepID=UPI001ABAD871|nr:BID domain-containing T4SS effector [Bartonella taylorii]